MQELYLEWPNGAVVDLAPLGKLVDFRKLPMAPNGRAIKDLDILITLQEPKRLNTYGDNVSGLDLRGLGKLRALTK